MSDISVISPDTAAKVLKESFDRKIEKIKESFLDTITETAPADMYEKTVLKATAEWQKEIIPGLNQTPEAFVKEYYTDNPTCEGIRSLFDAFALSDIIPDCIKSAIRSSQFFWERIFKEAEDAYLSCENTSENESILLSFRTAAELFAESDADGKVKILADLLDRIPDSDDFALESVCSALIISGGDDIAIKMLTDGNEITGQKRISLLEALTVKAGKKDEILKCLKYLLKHCNENLAYISAAAADYGDSRIIPLLKTTIIREINKHKENGGNVYDGSSESQKIVEMIDSLSALGGTYDDII